MGNKTIAFVCILKTGKLYEHDMAANALQENNIPFYKESESSSVLRFAMPFQPSMGPGEFYSILVPEQRVNDAKRNLRNLPIEITTKPDIWHYGASEKSKKHWKIYVWFALGTSAIVLLFQIINYIK